MKFRWAVAVFALSVAMYLPILRNGFVCDDKALVEENVSIREMSNIPTFFSADTWKLVLPEYTTVQIQYWRPLLLTSWSIVYRFFQLNPAGYHLLSIIMHAVCTVLVLAVGLAILGDERISIAAASIFALHPVHLDAVAWVSGFSDVLLAVFTLATLWGYHRFRTRKEWWAALLTLVCATFTMFSKESGIMLPVVLAAYEILLARREKGKFSLGLLGGSVAVVLACLLARRAVMGALDVQFPDTTLYGLVVTLAVVMGHYSRLLLFPVHLVNTYPKQVYASILERDPMTGIFFILLIGVFLAALIRNRKHMFWLFLMGITLLPAMNVIAVGTDFLGERYLYLPSVGFCFLLAELFVVRLPKILPSKIAAAFLILTLLGYAARDLTRFPDWRDEFTYLTATVRDAPEAFVHQNNLGSYFFNREPRDLERAEEAFEKSIALAPGYGQAHANLALLFLEKGDLQKALHHALRASEFQPGWAAPLISAAEAAGRLGDMRQSETLLLEALSLEPENAMIHNNMGNVAYMEGNLDEAVQWWEKAEELDPSNTRVLFNLALGYEALGANDQALAYYRQFLQNTPPQMEALRQQAQLKIEQLGD